MAGLYEDLMSSAPSPKVDFYQSLMRKSENIDDRRNPNGGTSADMTPEWKNVPASLRALGVSFGNYLFGVPMIPEAPDSLLSDALGKKDIRLVPQVNSRSPLDRAIDTVSDEISVFLPEGRKLGSDVPFTQRNFSSGLF